MQIPINQIIDTISTKSGLSAEEINAKIAEKMEELAGLISEEGAAHIIANELHVNLDMQSSQKIQIKDIKPYMKNLALSAKLVTLYDEIQFETNNKKGKVRSAIIGDETGVTKAVFWHNAAETISQVKEGDIILIDKVISKSNNARTEIHINDTKQITLNPEGIEIEVLQKQQDVKNKKIAELNQDDVVKITGVIVQSFNPTFFKSCPECRKRVEERDGKYFCDTHGEVEPKEGCVLNVVIDDGTGNIRGVSFSENAEKLYGKEISKDTFNKEELIGKLKTFSGKVRFSSFSQKNELVVQNIE